MSPGALPLKHGAMQLPHVVPTDTSVLKFSTVAVFSSGRDNEANERQELRWRRGCLRNSEPLASSFARFTVNNP